MSTSEHISSPVITWGIAAGIAVLSTHGGFPLTEGVQNYSLIEVPEPNSTLDISIAAIGGCIALFQYAISKKVEMSYQIAFVCGLSIAILVVIIFNPSFTLIQRTGLVVGGLGGSLTSIILAGQLSNKETLPE